MAISFAQWVLRSNEAARDLTRSHNAGQTHAQETRYGTLETAPSDHGQRARTHPSPGGLGYEHAERGARFSYADASLSEPSALESPPTSASLTWPR